MNVRPSRDIPVERTESRPERTPLGQRNRLTFKGQDPNYVYRWVNDKDDRLEDAKSGSYDFVVGDAAKAGDKRAAEAGQIDSRISKPAGNGVTAYLMRIPKDLYKEDQKAKMKSVDATEEALKPQKANKDIANPYGKGLTNE